MKKISKRLVRWAIGIALLLSIPLVLTVLQIGGWHWDFFDFIFMSVLLCGAAVTYELVANKLSGNTMYRLAVGLAMLTAVVLVWINAAVGIIGDGDLFDSPNWIYLSVLLAGLISAFMVRFQPQKMSRVMFAVAVGTAFVPVIAFVFWTSLLFDPPGMPGILALNSAFVALFIGSSFLFHRASAI